MTKHVVKMIQTYKNGENIITYKGIQAILIRRQVELKVKKKFYCLKLWPIKAFQFTVGTLKNVRKL